MAEHRWSGWPGAWCLDCGCDDPREVALADGRCDDNGLADVDPKLMECPAPGSKRFDPYASQQGAVMPTDEYPQDLLYRPPPEGHSLDGILAQLRHAYAQLAAGTVKNQKQFADGLIAPQIRELERIVRGQSR